MYKIVLYILFMIKKRTFLFQPFSLFKLNFIVWVMVPITRHVRHKVLEWLKNKIIIVRIKKKAIKPLTIHVHILLRQLIIVIIFTILNKSVTRCVVESLNSWSSVLGLYGVQRGWLNLPINCSGIQWKFRKVREVRLLSRGITPYKIIQPRYEYLIHKEKDFYKIFKKINPFSFVIIH